MNRRLFSQFLGAVAAAALCLGSLGANAADKPKIGFIYVGPVGDMGWSYQHDQGRKAVAEKFGDAVETTFVESVPEGADAERVIRQMAASGVDMIFTTSFGYMNATEKVAKQFPKVKFEHATGYKRSANLATYSSRFYEGRAVLGTIAGLMTKTNKIGYVASFPIPEVIRGINSAITAARKVNPEATMSVVWANTWYDPGKEAAAAQALLDQGVDVLMQHTDSPAPLQAASQRGLWAFGQASDMRTFAPEYQATAIVDYWGAYYISRVQALLDGTWKSEDTWGGFAADMVHMAPYSDKLPPEVIAAAEQVKADITSGKLHPFAGPLKKQDGSVAVEAGQVASDGELAGMMYYVEGVVGAIPQ
jgi:basic membrane protein A and related proteins